MSWGVMDLFDVFYSYLNLLWFICSTSLNFICLFELVPCFTLFLHHDDVMLYINKIVSFLNDEVPLDHSEMFR